MAQQRADEVHILLAASHQFGNSEVMDLQAQTRAPSDVLVRVFLRG